jgi:hypothetical protein
MHPDNTVICQEDFSCGYESNQEAAKATTKAYVKERKNNIFQSYTKSISCKTGAFIDLSSALSGLFQTLTFRLTLPPHRFDITIHFQSFCLPKKAVKRFRYYQWDYFTTSCPLTLTLLY